jgi:hypothetical protein
VEAVVVDDIPKGLLVVAVGHEHHLQVHVPVIGNDAVKCLGQQLTALLNRVQTRRPEEQRGLVVADQSQRCCSWRLFSRFPAGWSLAV